MDHSQHRVRAPGEYAAKYGWETTAHDPPPADVMARVVEGLNALDSETSPQASSSSDARNDGGDQSPDPLQGGLGR